MMHPPDQPNMRSDADGTSALAPGGSRPDAVSDLVGYSDYDGPLADSGASDGGPATTLSVSALLRSKWWIIGVLTLVSGTAVPCIWLFVSPEYKAAAVVRVSPVVSRIVFRNEDNGIVPLYRSYKNTQVSVIRSPAVLDRVLDSPKVRQTRWYKESPRSWLGGPPSHLERLLSSLVVKPRKDSELIEVSMSALSPKDATIIVDAVIDEYKRYCDERLSETDRRRLETLKGELQTRQQEIEGLIATKFNLAKRLGTVGPEELRSKLATHLSMLGSEYEKVQREHALTVWELELLTSSDQDEQEDGQESQTGDDNLQRHFVSDSEWRKLNIDLKTARHSLTLAHQQYGEAHPRIKQLVADVEHARRLLAERESQLQTQWDGVLPDLSTGEGADSYARDLESLQHRAQRQMRELELLKEEIARQRAKVAEAGDIAQDLARYDEEIRHRREIYEAVRTRLTELEMEGKAPARVEVAAYAHEPSTPAQDRRAMLTALAVGGGLMMGLAVAYLRTSTDLRIREAGDVRTAVRVPFLGPLPSLNKATGLLSDGDPLLAESMRMVRTALLERLHGSEQRVVLITSSSSRTGKSSVAVLLSRSLARLGKRTLLVEADLRRPSLSERLEIESQVGLAAMLTGQAKEDEGILRTDVPNLDVLLAGERPAEFNAEYLANGRFSACLKRWRESYDFVLLDSPPVLPVADTRILAGQVDGTVMVLRSSHCRRDEVVQAYADLSAAGGKLLGTVLVGVRFGSEYGRYGDYEAYARGPHALKA